MNNTHWMESLHSRLQERCIIGSNVPFAVKIDESSPVKEEVRNDAPLIALDDLRAAGFKHGLDRAIKSIRERMPEDITNTADEYDVMLAPRGYREIGLTLGRMLLIGAQLEGPRCYTFCIFEVRTTDEKGLLYTFSLGKDCSAFDYKTSVSTLDTSCFSDPSRAPTEFVADQELLKKLKGLPLGQQQLLGAVDYEKQDRFKTFALNTMGPQQVLDTLVGVIAQMNGK